jgi:hypothetical protein
MATRIACIVVCAILAGCAAITPPPDTAQLPFAAFGTLDNDTAATGLAASAFAVPARTANDPVDGARACAAIDYLAGELSTNPRWISISPLAKQKMLQARVDVRQVLGIRPDAPSQIVVNSLMQFAAAWQYGDQTTAMHMLSAPVFTLGPEQTLQILSNLPMISSANLASMDANTQMQMGGDMRRSR